MMMRIAEKPWVQQSYLGDKLDRRTANNLGNQFDNNRESKVYQVGQKRKFIGAAAAPIGGWAQKARFYESNQGNKFDQSPANFLNYNVLNSIFSDLDRDLIFGKKEFRDLIADQLGLKRSFINYERVNMVCGSFYIPKENEKRPQGEDAHFICSSEQTIGVADGVGGWVKCGIDAGEYARELMANARATVHYIRNNNNNNKNKSHQPIDPTMVLKQAYENMKSNLALKGSSTACILSLNKENGVLCAANVGDSGFMIFRDNKMVYKSPIMQKQFNFPYQLGNDVTTSDRVECAESFEVPFATVPGDVIVLGTDGLLDNVFSSEIEERLSVFANDGTNNRKDDCEELAGQIANSALYNSFNKIDDSPFSVEARKAGIEYRGGKIDDITVIVARVCRGRGISY